MPIPSAISDLSQTAADNYPTGAEVIGSNLDNYLRAHAAFIRQPYALGASSITAASTVDVGAATGESVLITGAATITGLGDGFAGCLRELRFDDACTLTHSSSLSLPGADNITTADGDVYTFRCTASGTWTLVCSRTASSGSSSGGIPQVTMSGDKTLALTDAQSHILRTGGNLTIPPNSSVAFPIGSAVTLVNDSSASTCSIVLGSGVTLYLATSTTSTGRTLAIKGVCTLLKTGTNTWYVSGAGLT